MVDGGFIIKEANIKHKKNEITPRRIIWNCGCAIYNQPSHHHHGYCNFVNYKLQYLFSFHA